MLNKGGKLKSGWAIWIRMCECNFKNPIWGHFLKKGAKIKKFWAYFEKCYNEFDFALRMRVLENKYCGGIFFPNLLLEQYEPLLWTSCPPPHRVGKPS